MLRSLASLLPFTVLEAMADKPLHIRGVAMCSGMSRNHNIYTSEELQVFTSKLANAPVYIEHVAIPNAIGKVTKTDWDGRNLWYEAEIYDESTAEKIRKGLIQHVSVGADYEAVDVVDGKVPHGLHNSIEILSAFKGLFLGFVFILPFVLYELSISVNLLTNLFLAALTTTITIITMAVTFRQKTNNH